MEESKLIRRKWPKSGWLIAPPLWEEFRRRLKEQGIDGKNHWKLANAAMLLMAELAPRELSMYVAAMEAADRLDGSYGEQLAKARTQEFRRRVEEMRRVLLVADAGVKLSPNDIDPLAAKTFQPDTLDDDGSALNPRTGNGKRPRRDKPRPKGSRRGR